MDRDASNDIVAIHTTQANAINLFCISNLLFSGTFRTVAHKFAAPVLSLTGMSELWIRAVSSENVGAIFVVENTAEPVAESGGCQPRRHACFAHDVHVRSVLDQQLEQRVPSAIRRAKQGIFVESGDAPGRHTTFE